jgi:hypothetical protein
MRLYISNRGGKMALEMDVIILYQYTYEPLALAPIFSLRCMEDCKATW